MLPFRLQVFFFRLYMKLLKLASYILPFREPELFEGPGSTARLLQAMAQTGAGKVLIVTDAMLVKIGLIKGIEEGLSALGVDHVIYDGVEPNPTIEQIENGVARLKESGCQAILAVGGGSSIDAAKIIAARATNNKPIRKMEGLFRVYRSILPLYAVPTTAGTGSEVTVAAVVSDPERQKKMAIMDLGLVPKMAALDAELMTGLPPAITAATGMDALTHAVEAYISTNATATTDAKAVEATRLIMGNLPRAYAEGGDLEARQAMARASYLAGIAFTRAGVGYVHAISHNFGAYYHTPHGLANAIVLPYVLDYSKPACTARLAELARACGFEADGEEALADAFIAHVRTLNRQFEIPGKLDSLKESDIPAIAAAAMAEAHSTYAVPRYMDRPTCESVVRLMLA